MYRSSWSPRPLLVLGTAWSLACGPSTPEVVPVQADACILTQGSSAGDTITVALGEPVNPAHAPAPSSSAERLLFRHLYQTLIRVDCHGEAMPGLAESWAPHEDNRVWSFTLRRDAAFWDGSPVTAESIRESWLKDVPHRSAPWADGVSSSVSITGERELTVTLRRPYQEVPLVFADPTLAVARAVDASNGWALGTGTYQVAKHTENEIHVAPLGAASSDDLPVLRFLDFGDDPRDAIDLGADLLITREPIVVDYIGTIADLEALPQPWDLVYVLVVPLRMTGEVGAEQGVTLAQTLGSGSVRTESRPPEAPLWWANFDACRLMSSFSVPPDPGDIAGRIVYRRSDPDGRALAERLVALAASGGLPQISGTPERLTAAGLGDERFAQSLAEGRDLGLVLAMPIQVLDPCAMIAPMHRGMPWVATADLHRVLVPLLETRSRIIVRQGVGTMVDWDGMPFLSVTVGR